MRITGIESTGTTATVSWRGGAASRQYLERRLDLVSTSDQWQAIHTNAPVTPVTNFFTDPAATNAKHFYRIRVERP